MSIDWAALERRLSSPYGSVRLRAGAHTLDLVARPISKSGLKYGIAVFVDGFFRGAFLAPDSDVGKRFYPLVKRRLVPKAEAEADLRKLTRLLGKAKARQLSGIDSVYAYRLPYWGSPKRLCAHLRKHEADLEVLEGP